MVSLMTEFKREFMALPFGMKVRFVCLMTIGVFVVIRLFTGPTYPS